MKPFRSRTRAATTPLVASDGGGSGRRRHTPLRWWRRSLLFRVVVTTVSMTLLIVTVLAWFLVRDIRDGLMEQRVEVAVAAAEAETAEIRRVLDDGAAEGVSTAEQMVPAINPSRQRGALQGFAVLVAPTADQAGEGFSEGIGGTAGVDFTSIPRELLVAEGEPGEVSYAFTEIKVQESVPGVEAGPGVAVATRFMLPGDDRPFTIYFLFPTAEQERTLALVLSSLTAMGFVLLLLVGGLAWLVALQVVRPIRETRRVAERLAAGQLQERLQIWGEDDLARLATSFNQMASSLQRQILQLEELSRLQRRFVSDVSHELRTPLTTVRLAADVMHSSRDDLDPVARRSSELLQTEIDRFETMLAELLEISRIDAGAAVLDIEEMDLTAVAHHVADVTAGLADAKGIRVVVTTDGVQAVAQGDRRRVERIVRNLVSNAIDHCEGSNVEVAVGSDADAVALTVRDHGVGLKPGESAMVFHRFWRADPARARTSGGTGLGLSIALEDARLHNGWLQAWGRPGQGAQFRLTLPRRSGESLRHSPLPLVPVEEVMR